MNLPQDMILTMLDISERYYLQDLKTLCEVEMKQNIKVLNAVKFLISADTYRFTELKTVILKFIKQNLQDIKKKRTIGDC